MAWNGRRYYERLEHQYSDWFALEEGQKYFLNGYHYDYNGYNHFSVAVEIEQSEIYLTTTLEEKSNYSKLTQTRSLIPSESQSQIWIQVTTLWSSRTQRILVI